MAFGKIDEISPRRFSKRLIPTRFIFWELYIIFHPIYTKLNCNTIPNSFQNLINYKNLKQVQDNKLNHFCGNVRIIPLFLTLPINSNLPLHILGKVLRLFYTLPFYNFERNFIRNLCTNHC